MLAAFADNDPSVAEDRDTSPYEWGGEDLSTQSHLNYSPYCSRTSPFFFSQACGPSIGPSQRARASAQNRGL